MVNGYEYRPVSDWYRGELEAQAQRGDTIAGGFAADLCAVMPGTIRVWATRGKLTAVGYEAYDEADPRAQREAMYRLSDVLQLARRRGGPFIGGLPGEPRREPGPARTVMHVTDASTMYEIPEQAIREWVAAGAVRSVWFSDGMGVDVDELQAEARRRAALD